MASKTVIVKQGQSLRDIALQYYGRIEGLADIAWLNDISMTERVLPGAAILITDTTNDTTKYFANRKRDIATDQDDSLNSGIGYMIIEDDFIVS